MELKLSKYVVGLKQRMWNERSKPLLTSIYMSMDFPPSLYMSSKVLTGLSAASIVSYTEAAVTEKTKKTFLFL